jgi:hypothetical protein
MPYQLRNRTRVANTEPTPLSAASSATLERNEDEADEPPLNRGSGTNRLKRGLSGSTKEGAGEFHVLRTGTIYLIESDQLNVISNKGPPPQKRMKRRSNMVNDKTLRTSMVKSLDMLYQGLQSSQRTTEALLGFIETQHRTRIFESLIKRELETLPFAQTRRLFEQGVSGHREASTHTCYWLGWGYVGATAPCDWSKARHRGDL